MQWQLREHSAAEPIGKDDQMGAAYVVNLGFEILIGLVSWVVRGRGERCCVCWCVGTNGNSKSIGLFCNNTNKLALFVPFMTLFGPFLEHKFIVSFILLYPFYRFKGHFPYPFYRASINKFLFSVQNEMDNLLTSIGVCRGGWRLEKH